MNDTFELLEDYTFSLPPKVKKKPVFSPNETGRLAKDWITETTPLFVILPDSTSIPELVQIYSDFPQLDFLPIKNSSGILTGYIKKKELFAMLSQSKYSRELMMRPEMKVVTIMEKRIIAIDAHAYLSETSRILMDRSEEIRFDAFVIIYHAEIFGIANVRDVMDGLNYYMAKDLEGVASIQNKLMRSQATLQKIQSFRYLKQLHDGVGGDYTEILSIHDTLHLALHFDVVGKGLKASSMVVAIGSLFKSLLVFDAKMAKADIKYEFTKKIIQINNLLQEITPDEMYATGTIAIIDSENFLLKLYDFGHGMFWLKRGSKVHTLKIKNDSTEIPFFGILKDITPKFQMYKLKSSDLLFSASDGVVETKNPLKEEFGVNRVCKLLAESEYDTIQNKILEQLESFRNGYRVTDDVSFYTIKI